MECWTQWEFLNRGMEALWFAFLMGTFNSMPRVNLNLQTHIYTNSFSLFSINLLNVDSKPWSHEGGRKFILSHFESSISLALCQDSWHLMMSSFLPSQSAWSSQVCCLVTYKAHVGLKLLARPNVLGLQNPTRLVFHVVDPSEIVLHSSSNVGEQGQAPAAAETHMTVLVSFQ